MHDSGQKIEKLFFPFVEHFWQRPKVINCNISRTDWPFWMMSCIYSVMLLMIMSSTVLPSWSDLSDLGLISDFFFKFGQIWSDFCQKSLIFGPKVWFLKFPLIHYFFLMSFRITEFIVCMNWDPFAILCLFRSNHTHIPSPVGQSASPCAIVIAFVYENLVYHQGIT